MADSKPNSTEAVQATAPAATKMSETRSTGQALVDQLPDFDALQEAIGTTRRSGPPLPESGDDSQEVASLEAIVEEVLPTEVEEPPSDQ